MKTQTDETLLSGETVLYGWVTKVEGDHVLLDLASDVLACTFSESLRAELEALPYGREVGLRGTATWMYEGARTRLQAFTIEEILDYVGGPITETLTELADLLGGGFYDAKAALR